MNVYSTFYLPTHELTRIKQIYLHTRIYDSQFIDKTLKSLNLNQEINTVFKRIIHTKHVFT